MPFKVNNGKKALQWRGSRVAARKSLSCRAFAVRPQGQRDHDSVEWFVSNPLIS